MTKFLLVVTGTRREGALVAGPDITVLAGGGDGLRLAKDLARLAPAAYGIVSFGTGGGLVPGLQLGDIVIGRALTGMLSRNCDAPWVQSLTRALPQARIGSVFADGTLLVTPATKAKAAETGAVIADMESHLAGAAAANCGLPFAILRCVSDTSTATLPPAVGVAMRPGGGLALSAVLSAILRQPGQLPALIRTGLGFAKSFGALQAAAKAVGDGLGFDQRE